MCETLFLLFLPSIQDGSTLEQQLWLHFAPSILRFRLPHTVSRRHLQSLCTLLFQEQKRLSGEPRT